MHDVSSNACECTLRKKIKDPDSRMKKATKSISMSTKKINNTLARSERKCQKVIL